jgi:hypothetical protein
MNAVIKTDRWVSSLFAAAMAVALSAGAATAQQQKAPAPKAAPKVETKAPAAAPAAKKAPAKKAASPCRGLAETACVANTACSWTKEVTTKKGQKRKAHCRLKPTPPKPKAKTTK